MNRFFSIAYILALISFGKAACASVIPLAGLPEFEAQQAKSQKQLKDPLALPPGMPDPNDEEAIRDFFKKRFEETVKMKMDNETQWDKPSSTSVVPPPEFYDNQKEKNKSTFEKIYEETLKALHQNDKNEAPQNQPDAESQEKKAADSATRFFVKAPQKARQLPQEERIPTVSVTLPNGRKILAPALEHIPYFLSYIDIQSNGYIKVEDTITIVANGKKFANGLERVFPKYTYYQGKRGHRIELILNEVTVNNTKVPYTAEENGNNILLKPKYNQQLEHGVYTYKFNYIINNKLQTTGNKVFMDWSLTGRPLNAFVTSANAIVSLPDGHSFVDVLPLVGRNDNVTDKRTNVFSLAKNVLAFSNVTPLLNGEKMDIITVMNRNVFIKNYDKNITSFLTDWGNVLYAGIGFAAILISFVLSLLGLKNESKNKYKPSYSGALARSIGIGKFDRIAYVAQLLDLFRKNALDMICDGGRCFLVIKNIKNNKLTKIERKALKQLFHKKTTQLEICVSNSLKLKKVKHIFEKGIKKQIKKYRLLQNISYVLFSVAMLLLTEIFIANISINMAQSLIIMLSCSLLFAFYIWILCHRFKYLIIGLLFKLFALAALIFIWVFCSIYIGGITSFLLIAMITTIFKFSLIFSQHNNFVNEAKDSIGSFKEYLISSADAINLSRDFVNQQANIFAFGISEYYPQNVSNKNYYRLDVAENIKQSLIGII